MSVQRADMATARLVPSASRQSCSAGAVSTVAAAVMQAQGWLQLLLLSEMARCPLQPMCV